jgi:hypothetical protein
MLKIKTITLIASAAMLISANVYGQDCSRCCSPSCFGYPSVAGCGCESGAYGQHPKLEAFCEENALIAARNDAWPKPFDCADRQLYHSMFNAMIDSGFEGQCALGPEHFDTKTNELNRFGVQAVAGIMQNMPSHRKQVFVNRDAEEHVSQARVDSVNSLVQTFYGHVAPNANVSLSTKLPASVSGRVAEGISSMYIEGAPVPVIPISAANQGIAGSVGN